jgi:hypothetical protein
MPRGDNPRYGPARRQATEPTIRLMKSIYGPEVDHWEHFNSFKQDLCLSIIITREYLIGAGSGSRVKGAGRG